MREAIQLGVFLASVRTRECTWVPGRGWEPEYPSDLQQEKLQRQNPQIPRSWRDSGTDVYSQVQSVSFTSSTISISSLAPSALADPLPAELLLNRYWNVKLHTLQRHHLLSAKQKRPLNQTSNLFCFHFTPLMMQKALIFELKRGKKLLCSKIITWHLYSAAAIRSLFYLFQCL